MAIDYSKWLNALKRTLDETEATINEVQAAFGTGIVLSKFPLQGEEQYSTGQLFFERIITEVTTAVALLSTANEGLVRGNDLQSQLLFDDLLKRQRKLFESLLLAIMLNRDAVWTDNKAQSYLLHVHLIHDYEHYRHLNADLSESFGKTNEFITECMRDIEKRIDELPIDQENCSWATPRGHSIDDRSIPSQAQRGAIAGSVCGSLISAVLTRVGLVSTICTAAAAAVGTAVGLATASKSFGTGTAKKTRIRLKPQSANAMFLNVREDATDLEKAALGLSYRNLFGLSSGQIHFTLSRFHTATANEWDLLQAVESNALLSACLALRLVSFVERMKGSVGGASSTLRSHFKDVIPNTLAHAVLGEAEIGDLVVVFRKEGSGNFFGIVTQKKFRGTKKYTVYEIEHATGGRLHWFGAPDVVLVVRKNKQKDFIEDAIKAGYANAEARGDLPVAIDQILTNDSTGKLFTGPMGDHLPRLYFVQEYLHGSE